MLGSEALCSADIAFLLSLPLEKSWEGSGHRKTGQKREAVLPLLTSLCSYPCLQGEGGSCLCPLPGPWPSQKPAQLLEWPGCLGFRVRPRTAGVGEMGGSQGASPQSPYIS